MHVIVPATEYVLADDPKQRIRFCGFTKWVE